MLDMTIAVNAMLVAALWSSCDEDGEPLDRDYGVEDIAPDLRRGLIEDLEAFAEASADDLAASGLSSDQVGHDFWLTRNGHGTGFWDRGLGEVGDQLTTACRPFGSVDLFVGDDGLVWG